VNPDKMFQKIRFDDKDNWNSIVKSFQHYEVYYLHGYVSAFRAHGDGEPALIYYNNNGCRAINVVMVRDLGDIHHLNLPKGELFDLVTPYGYGGFLVESCSRKRKFLAKYYNATIDGNGTKYVFNI